MALANGVTRRAAAGVLAGVPFVGRSAAAVLTKGAVRASDIGGSAGQANYPQAQNGAMPNVPKMQEWQAARLAMLNPEIKELLVAAAYAQHRVVTSIDPDIEVLRSLSPMAKITFQRQRNVANALKAATEEPIWSWGERGREFIRKLMWGN